MLVGIARHCGRDTLDKLPARPRGDARCGTSARRRRGLLPRRRRHRRLGEHRRAAAAAAANTPVASGAERAVEQLDELEHGDLVGGPGEAVAALDAALGAQDAGAAQRREQLLEELHRDLAAARELGDRDRARVAVAVQLDQRAQRVRRLGGDRDHRGPIVCRLSPAESPRQPGTSGRAPRSSRARWRSGPPGRDPSRRACRTRCAGGCGPCSSTARARRRSACRPSRAPGGAGRRPRGRTSGTGRPGAGGRRRSAAAART